MLKSSATKEEKVKDELFGSGRLNYQSDKMDQILNKWNKYELV